VRSEIWPRVHEHTRARTRSRTWLLRGTCRQRQRNQPPATDARTPQHPQHPSASCPLRQATSGTDSTTTKVRCRPGTRVWQPTIGDLGCLGVRGTVTDPMRLGAGMTSEASSALYSVRSTPCGTPRTDARSGTPWWSQSPQPQQNGLSQACPTSLRYASNSMTAASASPASASVSGGNSLLVGFRHSGGAFVHVETTLAASKQRPHRIVGKTVDSKNPPLPVHPRGRRKVRVAGATPGGLSSKLGVPQRLDCTCSTQKTSLRLRHLVASHWLAARPTTSIHATGTRSALPILPINITRRR